MKLLRFIVKWTIVNVVFVKAQSHIYTITDVQRTKNEEFRTVRCDSLGVRQNPMMILGERRMNVIHHYPEERHTRASLTLGTSRHTL